MLCPLDTIVCDTQTIKNIKLDVCPRCHGVWLDGGEMRQLMDLFTFSPEEAERIHLHTWLDSDSASGHTAPKDFWSETRYRCPVDRTEMVKHYIAGSTIGVDSCDVCQGFWLDGPELAALAKYVSPDPLQDAMGRFIVSEMSIPASVAIEDARTQMQKRRGKHIDFEILAEPDRLLYVVAQSLVHLFIK